MGTTSFTPSLAQNLRENARVCIGIAVLTPLLIYFLGGGSLQLAIIFGIGSAFAMFLFYTCRFLFRAPKRVECSDSGLRLAFRSGKIAQIAWQEVTSASFASIYGLRWKFRTASSTVTFRGDGFTGTEWFRISRLILEKLAARGIELSADLLGRKFLS